VTARLNYVGVRLLGEGGRQFLGVTVGAGCAVELDFDKLLLG
jgi:hypothetical protein